MRRNLLIFTFFLTFNILISLPSDEIWKKIQYYIKYGNMITNKEKAYFIFDELNYLGMDINDPKMEILYKKQEKIYSKYNVSNYIIIVKTLNERKESIEDATFKLSKYFNETYGFKMAKSVVALFSIETRRFSIRTGEITKNTITDGRLKDIAKRFIFFLKGKKYYKVCNILLENLAFYFKYGGVITLFLYLFAAGIFFCYCYDKWIKRRRKYRLSLLSESNLQKIIKFLKKHKSNKKILADNCSICLEEFNNNNSKKSTELNDENDSIKGIKINLNENSDITTLECGHQFHTTCISEWLKQRDNCPLWGQAVKYKNNLDDAHLIWGVQNERYNNRYSFLDFDDLFFDRPSNFIYESYDIKSKKSSSSSFDFGGGITGSW